MKLFTMILGAALAIGTLSAQNFGDQMKVKFSTPVVVNGVTLPAGEVTIQVIHNAGSPLLSVRSEAGPQALVLASRMTSEETVNEPKVLLD